MRDASPHLTGLLALAEAGPAKKAFEGIGELSKRRPVFVYRDRHAMFDSREDEYKRGFPMQCRYRDSSCVSNPVLVRQRP